MFESIPLLTLVLLLPVIGAIIIGLLPAVRPRLIHTVAIITAALTLLTSLAIWFKGVGPGFSQLETVHWIPTLGAAYRVGVDGISLPLILLTTILSLAVLIYSSNLKRQPRLFTILFLLLETASLGVFLSLDMLLFYVFFELSLVFMYFMIAGWGGAGRKKAAITFFIYTLLGSLPLLLAILLLYLGGSPRTFDMTAIIAAPPLLGGTAIVATVLMLIAFAVKIPLVPLHSWLPLAHVEAPTAGSVILAGVMLKIGTYGLIRFALQMTPNALKTLAPGLATLGAVAVIYGALAAYAQRDLKRLVAFTSINHMGYIAIAVAAAAVTTGVARGLALDGAVLQMFSHGIVTGSLFLLVGMIAERTGNRDTSVLKGLLSTLPFISGLFILTAFASLGLPGLAHFPAEFQMFLGSFPAYPAAVAVSVVGVVLTAAVYLRVISGSFYGEPADKTKPGRLASITIREAWTIIPLIIIIIAIGIAPGLLLHTIHLTTTGIGK